MIRLGQPDPYGPPSPLVTRWADGWPGPGGWALDLGCGHGRHSVYLARRGLTVDAVDHDEAALRAVRVAAGRLPVRPIQQDLTALRWTELPARPAGYDHVLLFRVLYQLPEPSRPGVVQRAAACLAPGGELLICDTTQGIDAVSAQAHGLGLEPVAQSARHRVVRAGREQPVRR